MSGLARDRPSLQGGPQTGSFHFLSPRTEQPQMSAVRRKWRQLRSKPPGRLPLHGRISEASLHNSCYCIGESQGQSILAYKTVEPMISALSSLRINTLNLSTPYKACLVLRPLASPGPTGEGGESAILTPPLYHIISKLCNQITSKTSLGLIFVTAE